MKLILILSFILGFITFSSAQDNHSDYIGNFYYYTSTGDKVEIKRTEKKQIEKIGKMKIVMSIEWTGKESYIMRPIKLKNAGPGCLNMKSVLHCKVELKEKYFTCYTTTAKCGSLTTKLYFDK